MKVYKQIDRFDLTMLIVITILITMIGIVVIRGDHTGVSNVKVSRLPRVVYLSPAGKVLRDLFVIDLNDSGKRVQLTHSGRGIIAYDTAPDGSSIVYAELEDNATISLFLLNLLDNTTRMLYPCQDAVCTNPVFRPDGNMIAFEKTDHNSDLSLGSGTARVWLLDLVSHSIKPLYTDSQQVGYAPHWSPDGSKLATFSLSAQGILLHDFTTGKDTLIHSLDGSVGQFSPDRRWLLFPKGIQLTETRAVSHLVLVDLTAPDPTQTDLIPDSDPNDDQEAIWSADSTHILTLRAASTVPAQLYEIDLESGQAKPLIQDTAYAQGTLSLSPDGDVLLFQRFPIGKSGERQLWTYDLTTGNLQQIATDAIQASWLR